MRPTVDPTKASQEDQAAKSLGRRVSGSGVGTCQTGCSSVRPTGLAPKY